MATPSSPARAPATTTTGRSMRWVIERDSIRRRQSRATTARPIVKTRSAPVARSAPTSAVGSVSSAKRAFPGHPFDAARVGRGDLELLGEHQLRQEAGRHHERHRGDDHPVRPVRQPAVREGERRVHEEHLAAPARDPSDGVEARGVRLGEHRDEPDEAAEHQDDAEPGRLAGVPRVEADDQRHADDGGPHQGDVHRVRPAAGSGDPACQRRQRHRGEIAERLGRAPPWHRAGDAQDWRCHAHARTLQRQSARAVRAGSPRVNHSPSNAKRPTAPRARSRPCSCASP